MLSESRLKQRRTAMFPVFLLCLAVAAPVAAGENGTVLQWFPAGPLMKSYPSELYSTMNRMELKWINKAPPGYPWSEGYSRRPLVDISLGMDIPILGGSAGAFSWYTGLPLSVSFLTDMFQKDTAAVVNTDYWFGTRIDLLYSLGSRWPRNIGLRILPFLHESTHLGDELSLFWSDHSPAYYRINISYEAWDLAVSLDEWRPGNGNTCSMRFGLSGRWNRDGYYPLPEDEEYGSAYSSGDFHLSHRRMEYYAQIMILVSDSFPAFGDWSFQAGLEVRNRALLDYFSDGNESGAWTVSTSLGWRKFPEHWQGRYIGYYITMLGGQNPDGQYREQNGYLSTGAGFLLGY